MISSLSSTGASSAPAAERTLARPPSARPSRSASSGWTSSVQRSLPFTSARQVVHPGVVRAQLAAADQQHAVVRRCRSRRAPARSRSTSATIGSGASSILPDGVRSTSGSRGSSGPRSTPCGVCLEAVERQPVRVGAEAVAVGAGAQQQVEQPLRPAPRLELAPAARRRRGRRPRECASADLARDQRAGDHVVERLDVGVRPLAGDDRPRAAAAAPTRPARRARRSAASSWPRCARRAGRARGRSGTSPAARAPAARRRRGGSSR